MQITKYPNTETGKLDLQKKAMENNVELFTTQVSISFRIFYPNGNTEELHILYF